MVFAGSLVVSFFCKFCMLAKKCLCSIVQSGEGLKPETVLATRRKPCELVF